MREKDLTQIYRFYEYLYLTTISNKQYLVNLTIIILLFYNIIIGGFTGFYKNQKTLYSMSGVI